MIDTSDNSAEGSFAPSGQAGLRITDKEFELFRALIHARTGISLGPCKRQLLISRLGKRLRALGLATLTEYHRLLTKQDPVGEEFECFVNSITTNKTDFFREPHHFDYLAGEWMSGMKARATRSGERTLRIWSAGCSSGEEPYTIALALIETLGPRLASWDVKILASDIDTEVLSRAEEGIYPAERVEAIPADILKRYFLRGTGDKSGYVRVRDEVRRLITFRQINFVESAWPIRARFDAIFCRNVLIYFDREMQRTILERLLGFLKEDGSLFLGHSESLNGLLLGLEHVANTVYRRAQKTASGPGAP